ncbi:hypothetical protein DPMN_069798 [Dreissena polymorpha]|uniref:Uncharacterized protein n=1 Tax=Dreissena polymorpha TaxID=45954 RepID=A0A9D3Z071_DREPO|nr:hypothetical protein DPMN_069798 [Dreissena polymorpha]
MHQVMMPRQPSGWLHSTGSQATSVWQFGQKIRGTTKPQWRRYWKTGPALSHLKSMETLRLLR